MYSTAEQSKKRKITLWDTKNSNGAGDLTIKDEISNFLNLNINIKEDSCPLKFYRNNRKQFPMISTIIKRLFCLTASSVPSEQLFSKAGKTINEIRNRLKPENAEMLILLDQDV